ncbi:MAG: DUF445 family protein [Clostridia bacterium]|nr:DUF445 family protein [Clostridia bacterium]
MPILRILLPILLGAVIGYFTNDLAIRMLFHPRKAVMIGKWQLPFTPGIIPKNQSRIAGAVGDAVSTQLFTETDLVDQLNNSGAKAEIARRITDAVFETELSLASLSEEEPAEAPDTPEESEEEGEIGMLVPDEDEGIAGRIGTFVTDRVVEKMAAADLHTPIEDLVWEGVQDYRRNPMIAMFLNASAVDAIIDKVEGALRAYLAGDGRALIRRLVTEEAEVLRQTPFRDLAGELHLEKDAAAEAVGRILDRFLEQFGSSFSEKTDIAGIVREKIESMDPAALEALIMSVMKRELQAVINLGALIGAVIGAVNLILK